MRTATIKRTTTETDIRLNLKLDGSGKSDISTQIGFLDHMLELFARHGGFDLEVYCHGDIQVDAHHSTEDIGIVLGQAFKEALGDKKGIRRYASLHLPMDETLVLCAADISGRGGFYPELSFTAEKIGSFDTELIEEFFHAFTYHSGITMHMQQLAGRNSHHIAEACFKASARVLREAVETDQRFADRIPSTKGKL